MALNFADAAKKKLGEIERPPLPPVGTYRWQITKLPETRDSSDGKWTFLNINVRALEAVSADMEDYEGDVTKIVNQIRFIFDLEDENSFDKTMFQARQFFEEHVKCADENDSLLQAMNNSVNQQFLGDIVWNPDKNNPGSFFANVARTAPLD